MKKRFLTMVLALTFAFSLIPAEAVHADQAINVTVNGKQVSFDDQKPVIVDGRTLVPIRGVFETMGFEVGWNNETRQATLTRDDDVVVITLGSAAFTANGVDHTLDVPAQVIGGRTLVPLRAVLESVGYKLDWDGNTSTVLIGSEPVDAVAASEPTAQKSVQAPSPEEIELLAKWGSTGEKLSKVLAELREEGNNVVHVKTFMFYSKNLSGEFYNRMAEVLEGRLHNVDVNCIYSLGTDEILIPAAIPYSSSGGANAWFIEALDAEGFFTGPKTFYLLEGGDQIGLYLEINIEGAPSLEQVLKFLENISDEEMIELGEQFGISTLS